MLPCKHVNTTSAPRRLRPRRQRAAAEVSRLHRLCHLCRPDYVLPAQMPETVPPPRLSPPSAPDKPGRKANASGSNQIKRVVIYVPSKTFPRTPKDDRRHSVGLWRASSLLRQALEKSQSILCRSQYHKEENRSDSIGDRKNGCQYRAFLARKRRRQSTLSRPQERASIPF